MSLGDVYQADVDKALDYSASLPVGPAKPAEKSLWKTAAESLVGAGSKAVASALEVGRVIGPALTVAADPTNDEALAQVKEPLDFRENEQSKPFRDFERGLRPDPATAGKAEQIVYGAVGPIASLVGGAVLGGVPGLLAASSEAGFSQSEDLAQQGVDLKTRSAVGGLTSGITAASALLPMAGPTAKATLGLYLAGGPAGFIAQQAATRKILEAADYNEIAQQYDPFDPVGLTLASIIPAPFAAWGLRGNLKAGKAPKKAVPEAAPVPKESAPAFKPESEQVDAAMAHNLTLLRDAQETLPPAKAAAEVMRPIVTETPEFKGWFGASKAVDAEGAPMVLYHGTASDFAGFEPSQLRTEGIHLTSDPAKASVYAASRAMDDGRGANVMPVYVAANKIKDVEFISPDAIRDAVAEGFDAVRRDDHMVVFEPSQIKSAIGNSGRFDPESPSLTDPIKEQPKVELQTVAKAKQAAEQMKTSGQKLDEFAATGKLEPDVQNLLIGLTEAGDDIERATRMLKDFDRTSAMQPGRSAADVAADVVEASREGRTVTPEPGAPTTATTPEKATAESVRNRISELEATAPDMVVRVTEDGKQVTLSEELARIRKEAAEGTDTELGKNDAALLQVAADCALATGQV